MATTKHRINITTDPDMERALRQAAKRDSVPLASKAAYLLRLALEMEEDSILEILAQTRDKRGVKFLSHKVAWR